jgi:metal-responsive CopG/Arc/MetJ family transcriptional regulator
MKLTAKVAVSIPTATLRSVERVRRRLKRSRSAIVAEALDAWLRARELSEADRRYVDGYLRQPETPDEVAVTEALAMDAMTSWEPWK